MEGLEVVINRPQQALDEYAYKGKSITKFLSLYFPLLGIKTANTEIRQTENLFFLEVSPLLTWGVLPVNSVGGAEGRGQNQAPFICCQSRVGVLSVLVLSSRGLLMRSSAQDQALPTLDAPAPLTEACLYKNADYFSLEGKNDSISSTRQEIISFCSF